MLKKTDSINVCINDSLNFKRVFSDHGLDAECWPGHRLMWTKEVGQSRLLVGKSHEPEDV